MRWSLPTLKAGTADYDKATKDLAELAIEQAAAERRIANLKGALQVAASFAIVPTANQPLDTCMPPVAARLVRRTQP